MFSVVIRQAHNVIFCRLGQSYKLFLKPPNNSKKKEIKWRKLYCETLGQKLLCGCFFKKEINIIIVIFPSGCL